MHPVGEGHFPFTAEQTRIARESLSNNKAPGLSRISKEDLEMGGDKMDELVAKLANIISESGKWPDILKKEVVFPLPKVYGTVDAIVEDQSRPISLLEHLDKWVERMIYDRIIKYVNFHECQAGYCLSCDHHTSLISDFVMNRNDEAYSIAVFTDIAKAFESVPPDELIDVVWRSEVPTAYKWVLTSFVENRQFRVDIKDVNGNIASSKWRKRLYGTPQGSVLGPLLWNMFFDPLLHQLSSQSVSSTDQLDTAFADDLTMLAASLDPSYAESALENNLTIFDDFLSVRGMEAASHKLKAMCLDPHKRGYVPTIRFKDKIVEVVDEHRSLGIIYEKDMSFTAHWKMVTSAVANRSKTMSVLGGVRWGPTQKTMLVLHKCYIESRIRYGMPAWYTFISKKMKSALEVYLRKSVRIAIGVPIHCWNESLLAEADVDSVADLELKCIVSLYSRINPTDALQTTMAKRFFLMNQPLWAKNLSKVPNRIWAGPIQSKLSNKVILTSSTVKIYPSTVESQVEADTLEIRHPFIAYTDASVAINLDRSGAAMIAFMWYTNQSDGSCKLTKSYRASIGNGHSSYSAESIAIREALMYAADGNYQSSSSIGIFTDSLSTLETIKKGVAESTEQEELLRTIIKFKIPIVFYHVRSHQDNLKNNAVDRLCSISSTLPAEDLGHLEGKKTSSKIKEWMDSWSRSVRIDRVVNNQKAITRGSASQNWHTRFLINETKPPIAHKHLPRKMGILLAKARTNRWTQCNWYLKFIKKITTDVCDHCSTPDTTEHVLDWCRFHSARRARLLDSLGSRCKVSSLLHSNKKCIVENLADFLVGIEEDRREYARMKMISDE